MEKHLRLVPLALVTLYCGKLMILGGVSLADMGIVGFLGALTLGLVFAYRDEELDEAKRRIAALEKDHETVAKAMDEVKTGLASLRLITNTKTTLMGGSNKF